MVVVWIKIGFIDLGFRIGGFRIWDV